MPRFKVDIHGEGLELERAQAMLNGAGIPTGGPVTAEWHGDPASRPIDTQMSAYLDAPTADRAEARVKDNLPQDGNYTVLPAEQRD